LIGDKLRPSARGACQDDSRALHLEPRERLAPRKLRKVRFVIGTEDQSVGFSATHGRKTPEDLDVHCHLNIRANFVQLFCPGTLGLRGSSDIHAFGDSNLYLRRGKDHLVLTTEHRAAPASPPIPLALIATNPETTHLEAIAPHQDSRPRSLQDQVLDVLAAGIVLTRAKLRERLAVKNERLGEVLESLERADRLRHTAAGWQRLD
jgi:hypothetical protein